MFYNSHLHTFKDVDVPRKFLPLGLVRILSTKVGFKVIAKILNSLNPFSDNDALDKYVQFIKIGRLGSQETIFKNCSRFYPENTKFAILPMDMAFMGAGDVPRNYYDQMRELTNLTQKYPQIIPFCHVDPRRPNMYANFKSMVEKDGVRGLKIYPPLGVFPYDEGLYPIYEYCEQNNIPVITHCSPGNPVHFKGSEKELKKLLLKSKIPIDYKGKSRKELCAYFTHPKNWMSVMYDFPKLKVCLAHFGSSTYWKEYLENPGNPDNWFTIIKDMIPKFSNLYTDISFTLAEQEYFPMLKVLLTDQILRERILFGSDYYMVETEAGERRFAMDLRAFIGEENFTQIATVNPERFFGV